MKFKLIWAFVFFSVWLGGWTFFSLISLEFLHPLDLIYRWIDAKPAIRAVSFILGCWGLVMVTVMAGMVNDYTGQRNENSNIH